MIELHYFFFLNMNVVSVLTCCILFTILGTSPYNSFITLDFLHLSCPIFSWKIFVTDSLPLPLRTCYSSLDCHSLEPFSTAVDGRSKHVSQTKVISGDGLTLRERDTSSPSTSWTRQVHHTHTHIHTHTHPQTDVYYTHTHRHVQTHANTHRCNIVDMLVLLSHLDSAPSLH